MTDSFDTVGGAATDYTVETGIQKIREGAAIIDAAVTDAYLSDQEREAVMFGMALGVIGGAHFVHSAYASLFRTLGYTETDIRAIQTQTMTIARDSVRSAMESLDGHDLADTWGAGYDEETGFPAI